MTSSKIPTAPAWGRYFKWEQATTPMNWRFNSLPSQTPMLPAGLGRSYGDSGLCEKGTLVKTASLNHFLEFDSNSGILTAEAGVSFADILALVMPQGWFLPVTPGTKYVTLGGAIANDVHGKNHHVAGTFGCHVLKFELLRSTGERIVCTPTQNKNWFNATIGGLGLTGFITYASIQLKPIKSPYLQVESIRYEHFDEFCELCKSYSETHEYTVAWVDALAKGSDLGRGIFMAANHSDYTSSKAREIIQHPKLKIPLNFPNIALNPLSIKAFNFLYLNKQQQTKKDFLQFYDPYFYPLDSIGEWNKVYGSRGFLQYQCVVPKAGNAMRDIMTRIAESSGGSFLTVLKEFGEKKSPGMLSFPKPGYTFALDFPNKGNETLNLLEELDQIVLKAQGSVYPAKDARMSGVSFKQYYPQWENFVEYIDPNFSSSFWKRVTS